MTVIYNYERGSVSSTNQMEIAKLVLEFVKALAWPTVVLLAVWFFRRELSALVATLEHVKLPGGAELEWKRELKVAEAAAEKVEASEKGRVPEEATRDELIRQIYERGFLRSPSEYDFAYYRALAERDPSLALAGLRMELERMLQNMARVAHVDYEPTRTSTGKLAGVLRGREVLEQDEYDLLRSIINVANAALHGRAVESTDALRTIESAEAFKDSYLSFMAGALAAMKHLTDQSSGLTAARD